MIYNISSCVLLFHIADSTCSMCWLQINGKRSEKWRQAQYYFHWSYHDPMAVCLSWYCP